MNLSSVQSGRITPDAEPHFPLPRGEGQGGNATLSNPHSWIELKSFNPQAPIQSAEREQNRRPPRIIFCSTRLAVALLWLLTTSAFSANTSPLADAAEKSDLSALRTLLKTQTDVDAPQPD